MKDKKIEMLEQKLTMWMEQEFKWTSTMIYIVYQMDEIDHKDTICHKWMTCDHIH
jgi:hypothetical protein